MSHAARMDYPGSEHHVFSRGMSRRTVFENKDEIRYFLSRLAWMVHAGKIEILAFSILTTHYHLWLRSVTGELSETMCWVLHEFVCRFNRRRGRDGSLFRARFGSRPVGSNRYRKTLLRYEDFNPVKARLVKNPWDYPYGSAMHYCSPRRPKWLSTGWVDALMGNPPPHERLQRYAAVLGAPLDPAERELVERRLAAPPRADDEFDHLVNIAPPAVLRWMKKKAALADGTEVGVVCCVPTRIREEVLVAQATDAEWRCKPNGKRRVKAWPMIEAALLRQLGGLSMVEIAARLGTNPNMARTRLLQHRRFLETDAEYARRSAELASACLRDQ
ncbi:MAG: sigma-70 region 4 domain-containing protein [Deltaproteobacteria bacterium]|nr:sigma-70 region 4 domain-containing protein [Deltaproteobacteria bacterium]